MSPPIDIDGSEIQEATIDGQDVSEITIDGQQAADLNIIPDSGMFQNPIYQWTAPSGLGVSDGATASSWTDQLTGIDASATGSPLYQNDQAGFEAVEYDGTDDGHEFPSDANLPTGTDSVSFAATLYAKSKHNCDIVSYGNADNGGEYVALRLQNDGTIRLTVASNFGNVQGGSYTTGSWITVGGSLSLSQVDGYLNGSNIGTDTNVTSYNLQDADRGFGFRSYYNDNYADIYLYDLVLCAGKESDQAFSDYHSARLG